VLVMGWVWVCVFLLLAPTQGSELFWKEAETSNEYDGAIVGGSGTLSGLLAATTSSDESRNKGKVAGAAAVFGGLGTYLMNKMREAAPEGTDDCDDNEDASAEPEAPYVSHLVRKMKKIIQPRPEVDSREDASGMQYAAAMRLQNIAKRHSPQLPAPLLQAETLHPDVVDEFEPSLSPFESPLGDELLPGLRAVIEPIDVPKVRKSNNPIELVLRERGVEDEELIADMSTCGPVIERARDEAFVEALFRIDNMLKTFRVWCTDKGSKRFLRKYSKALLGLMSLIEILNQGRDRPLDSSMLKNFPEVEIKDASLKEYLPNAESPQTLTDHYVLQMSSTTPTTFSIISKEKLKQEKQEKEKQRRG